MHNQINRKLFKNRAKIAIVRKAQLKVPAHELRKDCAIFATLFTNVMYKGRNLRDTVANGTQNGYKGAREAWLPLLPVPDLAGSLGIEKWGVQAAFTMVSVGYLEATVSWANIVPP